MKHISSLSCAVAALGLVVACGPSQRGPVLNGAWRAVPEDLPYTGAIPNQTSVSFNVIISSDKDVVVEGWGSITPFYSSEELKHVAAGDHETFPFTWSVADEKHMTWEMKDGDATCQGEITENGEHVDMTVAGCPPLADRVGEKTVRFGRVR